MNTMHEIKYLYECFKQYSYLLRDNFLKMADILSGGQRHELALAMALDRKLKSVFLDEPSAGLSSKAVEEMYGMLSGTRKMFGITILLIEQNMAKVVGFCERCLISKHVFTYA